MQDMFCGLDGQLAAHGQAEEPKPFEYMIEQADSYNNYKRWAYFLLTFFVLNTANYRSLLNTRNRNESGHKKCLLSRMSRCNLEEPLTLA